MVLPVKWFYPLNGLAKIHLSFEWANPLIINSLFRSFYYCISLFFIILFYLYTCYIDNAPLHSKHHGDLA